MYNVIAMDVLKFRYALKNYAYIYYIYVVQMHVFP